MSSTSISQSGKLSTLTTSQENKAKASLTLSNDKKAALAVELFRECPSLCPDLVQEKLVLPNGIFRRLKDQSGLLESRVTLKKFVSSPFVSIEDFPQNALLHWYTNEVGNFKSVILVEIDGKKCVFHRKFYQRSDESSEQYQTRLDEYEKLRVKRQLPPLVKLADGKHLPLFMGSHSLDWKDESDLSRLAELACKFSEDKRKMDCNPGNLVIYEGELFYVDQDCGDYILRSSVEEALLANKQAIEQIIADENSDADNQKIQTLIEAFQRAFMMYCPPKYHSTLLGD